MTAETAELVIGNPRDSSQKALAPGWLLSAATSNSLASSLASLKGDFALAARTADGRSVAAVDRFAARSLCYQVQGQQFQWSESALDLGGRHAELDPQALFEFFYFHVIPSPRTIFKGVYRLPPARLVEHHAGKLEVRPYWHPVFKPQAAPDFQQLKTEFRRLLRNAVERRLDGGIPACFLSGGTDSSTVAGFVKEVAGKVSTYSIGFEAEGYDEMEFARIAAKRYGADHHEYYVTPDDLVRNIGLVAASYDQPFGNSSALPAYCCALRAREDGVTRILAGDGGDELFGGNSRYATHEIFDWYKRVPQVVRSAVLEPFFGIPFVGSVPGLKKGTGYIRQANTPMPERLQAFNLIRRLGYGDVLEPGFLSLVSPKQVSLDQSRVWAEAESAHEIDRHLAYDWRYTLAEADLPKVRGTTALAGVDVGFPMLDDELLSFSMQLPPHYKLNRLRLRWFFKEALRGFLPDEILTKKKQGFGLPFGVWALRHPKLHALVSDSARGFAQRGIVKPAFVDELLNTHLPSHPHYYGTMLWILMMAEQWMRVHRPDFKYA